MRSERGLTLIEILVAMTLLVGLVVPLGLAGIRYVSVQHAKKRLATQQQVAWTWAQALTARDSVLAGATAPLSPAWTCDTLAARGRSYVILRKENNDTAVVTLAPLADSTAR
jgi:prepilin-type N-terminal cleavage/methylation domain-containing protein